MTAGNKLSRIIAVFLCVVTAFGIITLFSPREEVLAKPNFWVENVQQDKCTIVLNSGKKNEYVMVFLTNYVHDLVSIKGYSKPERCKAEISGKTVKDEQFKNIPSISIILLVFHFEISGKVFKDSQPANNLLIFTPTFIYSSKNVLINFISFSKLLGMLYLNHFEISGNAFSDEHPENNPIMFKIFLTYFKIIIIIY